MRMCSNKRNVIPKNPNQVIDLDASLNPNVFQKEINIDRSPLAAIRLFPFYAANLSADLLCTAQ